jgi:hypothetical protein
MLHGNCGRAFATLPRFEMSARAARRETAGDSLGHSAGTRNIHQLTSFLIGVYDRCTTLGVRHQLERCVVWLAAGGFVAHLMLIALARSVGDALPSFMAGLDLNYLHAVYTPFSFILFYEVLLLIVALPRSHTTSIGKQYEIVSLIVIRRVFKDIGAFRDPATWFSQKDAALMVLADMCAAVLMFLLVTGFHRLQRAAVRSKPHEDLQRFVAIKKSVAVVLCGVLILLAAYNVWSWLAEVLSSGMGETKAEIDLDVFFFPAFFEFMIFTDVFLLIVSLLYYDRYEYVIRNAGFVISTVLLRFSLSTPKPYDLIVGLIAITYGLSVLAVFASFTRVVRGPQQEKRA